MKSTILMTAALFISTTMLAQESKSTMTYPNTKKTAHVDDYFGTSIPDPYRWLEDDLSAETGAWVDAQNALTQDYLSKIPYRQKINSRLSEIWNYEKIGAPFQKGKYYFYYKNNGLQNQSILYYKEGLDGTEKVFIDPNTLSSDGTVALSGISFSKDYTYAAYVVSKSGSDWNDIYVKEVATGKVLNDKIEWVKFSGAAWRANGFYYSRYDKPSKGSALSGQNEFQKIYFHTLGEDQSKDVLIFEDKQHPLRYFSAELSEDEQFLIIQSSEGTSGSEILIQDLRKKNSKIELLLPGFKNNYAFIDAKDGKLFFMVDQDAPNYRLVAISPESKSPDKWIDIIPQQKELLEGVYPAGGKLYASYLKDAQSQVVAYDYNGKKMEDIKLPGIGTVAWSSTSKKNQTLYYTFSNFTTPGQVYSLDIATGESKLYSKPAFKMDTEQFETKQLWFKSKDGTRIPMFVVHKKGIVLDGNNPTLLYGYGGFNISLSPAFSISNIYFLEQGGVYAQVSLRGGGEYGEDWHKAGMLEKKQNVFDDFIAAAEFLISEKYTQSSKLAISGRSNGGLLVGAAMTQRPDLFKVAMPGVGVLDMLRYHKFTIGWGWAVEYGSSDKKEQFDYLIKYSPLHNIKQGVSYPATMVITADHDDRVVPAHSFKFAATLQAADAGPNAMLIRIDKNAGHGAGKPTSKQIADATDFWAFVFWNLGVAVK